MKRLPLCACSGEFTIPTSNAEAIRATMSSCLAEAAIGLSYRSAETWRRGLGGDEPALIRHSYRPSDAALEQVTDAEPRPISRISRDLRGTRRRTHGDDEGVGRWARSLSDPGNAVGDIGTARDRR